MENGTSLGFSCLWRKEPGHPSYLWSLGAQEHGGVREGTRFKKEDVQNLQGPRLWQALKLETMAA